MKIVLAIFAIFAVALALEDSARIVNEINSNPKSSWTAGHNKFSHWTKDEVKSILGTSFSFDHNHMSKTPLKNLNLPDSYDVREAFPGCSARILDQAKCGSCWAFGTTEALSDVYCIKKNMTSLQLSPQDPVSCDRYDMGCNGGSPDNVWTFLKETGAVDLTCMPYTSGGGEVAQCPTSCTGSGSWTKYKCKDFEHVYKLAFWETEKAIREAIVSYGSVSAAFTVYEDFMHYSGGVYEHKSGSELGGHMVKIIGWGVDSGTDYWLVQNSWGDSWGLKGLFKIKRSGMGDECGIQGNVYACKSV